MFLVHATNDGINGGALAGAFAAMARHFAPQESVELVVLACLCLPVALSLHAQEFTLGDARTLPEPRPALLLGKSADAAKVWYPTLIGESDKAGGETVQLLHAEFRDLKSPARRFVARSLTFRKANP